MGDTLTNPPALELPADHPGFSDPDYRARRAAIAEVGARHRSGQPIAEVHYTPEEDGVWRVVSLRAGREAPPVRVPGLPRRRRAPHPPRRPGAPAPRGGRPGPGAHRLPHRARPRPGAHRHVLRGPRRAAVPVDAVHPPPLGAASTHRSPTSSTRSSGTPTCSPRRCSPTSTRRQGAASQRATTPEARAFFSRVFWFTLEFGVVWEDGELRAYGAGLLSSYGEIEAFRDAEIRPWDLAAMGRQHYDITQYQPVLFAAPSFEEMVRDLMTFFDTYDDARHDELAGAAPAACGRAALQGWDCVELWVGNARTTAGFLMSTFGFTCTGYAGPETGVRDKASYVLEQGDIRLVVTGALDSDSPIARHVLEHGDGVHDLAWIVDDARAAYDAAVDRGARPVREPWTETDDHGTLAPGPDRHLRRDRAHLRRAQPLRRRPPRARLHRRGPAADPGRSPGRPGGHRPRRRQRRAGPARALGRLLPAGPRVRPAPALRRRPDQHRVLRPHVDGRVGRHQGGHAAQRAGRRPQEEPDPGVRRDLPRPRRAAHRPADRGHRRHGRRAARPGPAVHDRAPTRTTRRPASASTVSSCPGTTSSA